MIKKNLHILSLFLVLVVLVPNPLCGQKKKKAPGVVHASGTRLREAEFYFTEGEKFFILEDYAKALSYYQRTLEITPENATVHYKIAEVLSQGTRSEDLEKASYSIDQALRLEKKNKYFYLLAANIYTSLARFEKAAAVYESMITEVKGTEEYLYELAAVYQYGNKPEEAIKAYQRAENVLGINEISSIQKQRLYLEQGKTKEALAEGEKLIRAFPTEERYIMSFTELLSQKGLKTEAVNYLEKFVTENKDAWNTQMLLAGYYRDNGMEEKARPLLSMLFENPEVELNSKLIILGSYNAELNNNRTRSILEPEKEKFVEDLFQKLRKTNPADAGVHIVGGDLFLSIGKNQEAVNHYLQAIKQSDVNFEVWQNLLYLENQLDRYEDLIRHSDQALELFPNQGLLYYFNGAGHLRKRHYDEAIASFEQAKRLSGTNPSLLGELNTFLGEAYNGKKEFEKSDKAFEEALLQNPNNTHALNNYSYYLALRKVNLEKAERMSALLVKNHPENPAYLDTHAWVLFTRGKYKEAKRMIERAIETGKATATHFEHYGDILYKAGDVDGAVIQWEKARGTNASNESLNKKIANRKMYE